MSKSQVEIKRLEAEIEDKGKWIDEKDVEIERLQTALGKIRRIASAEIEKQGINANIVVKKLQQIYAITGEPI